MTMREPPKAIAYRDSALLSRSRWPLVILLIVVVLAAWLRVRMIDIPLERDEGEYAYAGQLILRGIAPYELAYTVKPPGTAAMYAASMAVFGETVRGVRGGFLLVNIISIALVFLLARQCWDAWVGAASSAAFAAMSTSISVYGQAGHATHYVVLWALAGLVMLNIARVRKSFAFTVLSGVLLGTALVMKQAGVVFAIFAACVVAQGLFAPSRLPRRTTLRLLVALAVGGVIPWLLTVVVLWKVGAFNAFWFWTFTYAGTYGTAMSLADAYTNFIQETPPMVTALWPLLALATVGSGLMWLRPGDRSRAIILVGFLLLSIVGVCFGLYFRRHYFVLMLPATAMLAGVGVREMVQWLMHAKGVSRSVLGFLMLACVAAVIYPAWQERAVVFAASPGAAARAVYGANPFPESEAIAQYIRENSPQDARIAVVGSEPQIYFLSQRLSATGYIYGYPLMESHPFAEQMQRNMIAEIESAMPAYLVTVSIPESWLARTQSPTLIFTWLRDYCEKHYRKVGLVELRPREPTRYIWGAQAETTHPQSRDYIVVYMRRSNS